MTVWNRGANAFAGMASGAVIDDVMPHTENLPSEELQAPPIRSDAVPTASHAHLMTRDPRIDPLHVVVSPIFNAHMTLSKPSDSRTMKRQPSIVYAYVTLWVVVTLASASPALGQTGYYNTDASRPLTVEDAHAIERGSLEVQPLTLSASRHARAVYALQAESEVTLGILPHTQVDASIAWRRAERGDVHQAGVAGLTMGVLHGFNVETQGLPALGLAAELQVPVGAMAPSEASLAFKALATRTFVPLRLHLNASYAFGRSPATVPILHGVIPEVPRWLIGVAADKALALRSLLLSAEVLAKRPTVPLHATVWESAAGVRFQLDPRIVLDAGVSRHLTGDDRSWTITLGAAYSRGLGHS